MNFETFEDALRWRKVHRRKLKAGKKRHRRAARVLANCRSHRCGSEACRVCMRDFRLWWVGEATKIMVQRPDWTRCSIIPMGLLVPYGRLHTFDLEAAIKRLRKRMQRSALRGRVVLGGLDISLNLENNVIAGWQFHAYLIVEGWKEDSQLQQAIKDAFPPEPTALVPYDFEEVTDPLAAITYAYKADIKRRSGFIGKDGNHHTKDLPLKGSDIRELGAFLAKYKVGARLLLAGVRRNGQRLDFTTPATSTSRSGDAPKAVGGGVDTDW
jgi:hypothetical protein